MKMLSDFHALTEWNAGVKPSQIEIHIYQLPVRNIEERHHENGKVVYELSKLNHNQEIVFYEKLIGSFQEITDWGGHYYSTYERRSIRLDSTHECALLERLLLKHIEISVPKDIYFAKQGRIDKQKPIARVDNITIRESIQLDVTVSSSDEILIGFDLSHRFRFVDTLIDSLKKKDIKPGDSVIDPRFRTSYEFVSIAPFTISEYNDYLGQSIIDYYRKNKKVKIEELDPKMRAVLVRSKDQKILPYLPTLLHKDCSFKNLPQRTIAKVNPYIKMDAHQKMTRSISEVERIIGYSKFFAWNKKGILIQKLGFQQQQLSSPLLQFGNNKTNLNPLYGLKQGGVINPCTLEISYFVDPEVISLCKTDAVRFMEELESLSAEYGVTLQRKPLTNILKNKSINFASANTLPIALKLNDQAFTCLTVVITTEENAETCYGIIKRELGGNLAIPTQFVLLKQLDLQENSKTQVYTNILLGIYAKAGIQPWILKNPLHSDCFIGLDVSHESGRHSTGIVQVIGKDGTVLVSKPMSSSEAGEKIRHETMTEIVHESLASYEKYYGNTPKHITFHRDGRCREDLDKMTSTFEELRIGFDYIEIIKDTRRRMASYNTVGNKWVTNQGCCYLKGNTVYLCSTNPRSRVGMAQPIKINQVVGSLPMEAVISDVYHLSFMHIGSLLKSRLPVTTHYADLSSTFYNRGWIPQRMDGKAIFFV
jgi:hypothetical protein